MCSLSRQLSGQSSETWNEAMLTSVLFLTAHRMHADLCFVPDCSQSAVLVSPKPLAGFESVTLLAFPLGGVSSLFSPGPADLPFWIGLIFLLNQGVMAEPCASFSFLGYHGRSLCFKTGLSLSLWFLMCF